MYQRRSESRFSNNKKNKTNYTCNKEKHSNIEIQVNSKQNRIESAWLKWSKNQTWEAESLFDAKQAYQNFFHFIPRDFQEKVFTKIARAGNIGLVILEEPMGCGKTEATLMAAEQLAGKQECGGVFFGLPTQASSNGIFPRVKSWVDALGKRIKINYLFVYPMERPL